MNERIKKLTELTLKGEMYAYPTKTEYDREDLFLSRQQKESKQLCEFILNQEPVLTEYSKMTGFFNCDGSVVGDAFRRMGHKHTAEVMSNFYLKSIDNLSTMEWQHATADYQKVLEKGIKGIIAEIDDSLKVHTETEEIEFLNALKSVANALIGWAHKCSDKALELSKSVKNKEYKKNLEEYGEFLAEDFFVNHGNKVVVETIRENNSMNMKKLFKLLNDIYEDGTNDTQSIVAVTILGCSLAENPDLIDNAKEYFSDTMNEPVNEIIKYLRKSKSARLRLQNPPLYKPKKEKKKGMMASMLGM